MTLILSGTDGLSDVDGTAATPAIRGTDANTGIFFGTDIIGFSEGGVEAARFNASGNLQTIGTISVGSATPSTSGAGITFPATQSASSDANTLDDYEEGTWTPNQGNGLSVVGAFSSSGTYTKVGRQVTVIFAIAGATTIAVTAGAQITGNLPFTAAASMDNAGTIYRFGATGGECIAGGSQVNAFSGATIAAGGGLNISITYFV